MSLYSLPSSSVSAKVISDKAKKLTAASSGKDDGASEARSKLKELKVLGKANNLPYSVFRCQQLCMRRCSVRILF